MWVEWIDDPKMLSLSLAEQGAWWRLVTLAKKCAADGYLIKSNESPLSLDEIANALRIRAKADRKVFDSMVGKMTDQGSLHWSSGILVVTHFAERQAKVTSETPEAIRDRVRRHREKMRVTENPLPPLTTPINNKDIDIDTEVEVESNGSVTQEIPLHVTENPLHLESMLAEIAKLHEQNIGQITPLLSEKIKDFVENYRGPIKWIKEAFAEAVSHNVRKWAYVETILNNWQSEGRKPHGERKKRKATRDEAHQRGDQEPSAERYRQSLE